MTRHAVFRVDASATIGAGHVSRCDVLADELRASGWVTTFAVRDGTFESAPGRMDRGIPIVTLGGEPADEADLLRREIPDGCDLLVVDHYELDQSFEVRLRPWAAKTLVIDDLADRSHVCDVLLDQTPGRSPADYSALVPRDARLLLGGRFALLRREFREARSQALDRRTATSEVRRVLVSFGAVDSRDLTSVALQALASTRLGAQVDVMLGPSAPHLRKVARLVEESPLEVTLHVDARDVARLVLAADLALGAGGVSALERCCLGLPSVLVVVAPNQRLAATALHDLDAAVLAGESQDITPDGLTRHVRRLATDTTGLRAMARHAAQVCDGEGADRVVRALTGPTDSPTSP